ncbi:MAG: lipocalin family protein [Rhodospirillaceae bacterium]
MSGKIFAAGILGLSLLLAGSEAAADEPLAAIAKLDLPRYLGTWHEITKYPNRFQKKCVSDTSADYSLQSDGSVRVVNRCKMADGAAAEAIGQAVQTGGPDSPKLQVRFAPWWLSFLPMVWGDYWVVDLDETYRLAAVSEPSRKYLWVLSRTSTVDAAAYRDLLKRLESKGFDLTKLEPPVGLR